MTREFRPQAAIGNPFDSCSRSDVSSLSVVEPQVLIAARTPRKSSGLAKPLSARHPVQCASNHRARVGPEVFATANATGTLGLFKPGALPTVTVALRGPAAPTNPADLNSDQIINAADLAILLNAWGTAGPGDINASGSVDAADLAALLSAWTG